ncbi:MAG: serine hydrolase domain-containing protein [Vicinamibacterales bacterium]
MSAFLIAFCLSAGGVGAQPSSPAARPPSALDAPLVAHIDALARVEAQAERLSGVMLVARGDRVVFQQAYGFASWELQTPVTPTTRFGIGSITKVMTETVVDALVREGRLDLSAPVSRYLGSFPTGPKGGVVTVRHLVDHRSGIPHRVTMQMEETLPLHPSDIVERVRARGLLFEPGLQELYSSAGFSCLARVIELIERQPFGAVLRDRIFRPAAMATASDETGQQLMPLRALPYRLGTSAGSLAVASASYKHLGFLTGAGSVYATVDDLLRFVRASRNGVFGPAAKERVVEKDGQPWRSWYGRTDGYEASVDVLPSADVTFVFVSNLRSAANWQLRERVKDLLLGREPGALPRPPTPLGAPFEPFDSVVGSYGDPADPIVIALVDGHLFRDDSEIYPIAEGRYYLPASGTVMRFRRTGDGTVDALLTVRPWENGERLALKVPGA